MNISLVWVIFTAGVSYSVTGAQWPPLRAAGLLGVENRGENRGGNEVSNQPVAPKKPGAVPAGGATGGATGGAAKADKPVGEGSFDDFGFGPDAGVKPTVPAVGAGAGKPAQKAAPGSGMKPPAAAAVSKPIGPVRLTARPEPLPKLALVVAATSAGVMGGATGAKKTETTQAAIAEGGPETYKPTVRPTDRPAAAKPEVAKPEFAGTKPAAKESGFVKGKRVK